MAGKKVTIRDVARAVGVCPATVSLALKGDGSAVARATRERVESVARRLDYRLSGVGRPLGSESRKRGETARRSVVFLSDYGDSIPSGNVFSQVVRGIEKALGEEGLELVIQRRNASWLTPGCFGVVILGAPDLGVRRLLGDLPFVRCMGLLEVGGKYDHITYCNLEIGAIAADYLVSRGHRVVCAVGIDSDLFLERTKTFRRVAEDAGCSVRVSRAMAHHRLISEPEVLLSVFDGLLRKSSQVPTGIFCPADSITSMAYPVLYSMGLVPGRDVEVVSCDNTYDLVSRLLPKPSVIDIRAEEIGRIAGQQLMARIKDPLALPVKMQIQPELILNETAINIVLGKGARKAEGVNTNGRKQEVKL